MDIYKINRNNTNFPIELFEKLKNAEITNEYDFLKYHQNIVRIFCTSIDIEARGLLVYHSMGMGKTILAIAIAMEMFEDRQPIILLTKSLQENFRNSIIKYVRLRTKHDKYYKLGTLSDDELLDWIKTKYSFVSMNASNMIQQMVKATEGTVTKETDEMLDRAERNVLKYKRQEAAMKRIVSMGSLDNKLLIVDEAHNLFRSITNGSSNAAQLYDMIVKAKNLKIVFLTGTPVASDPFELSICFNMIGTNISALADNYQPLFPMTYKNFYAYFVDEKTGKIKNKEKFQNRIFGLVSHVTHESSSPYQHANKQSKIEFPEEFPLNIQYVHMGPEQYTAYKLARDKELEEGKGFGGPRGIPNTPALQKPKSGKASTYRVRSRQISNYYCNSKDCPDGTTIDTIPKHALSSTKFARILENIKIHKNTLGLVYSQFVDMGGLKVFARFLNQHGYEEYKIPASKLAQLKKKGKQRQVKPADAQITNVSVTAADEGDIGINDIVDDVVSDAVGNVVDVVDDIDNNIDEIANNIKGGGSLRNKFGNNEYFSIDDYIIDIQSRADDIVTGGIDIIIGGNNKQNKQKYALITGDVSIEERQEIQDVFNSTENQHGGIIDLLLISSTGAEGLDLKNVRHIHIMEPPWKYGRIDQVIARGVRNDSHIDLPPKEKNVQPYIYIAISPDVDIANKTSTKQLKDRIAASKSIDEVLEEIDPNQYTTDMELFRESIRGKVIADSFNQSLKEVSIECLLNEEDYCRSCQPTNQELFNPDVDKDIKISDPCIAVSKKEVSANEIIINGTKYYYIDYPDSIFDYQIYEYSPQLNSYQVMSEDSSMFGQIINEIKKHNKSSS